MGGEGVLAEQRDQQPRRPNSVMSPLIAEQDEGARQQPVSEPLNAR